MSNDLLPIIRQMHDAADDRARADILLRCPDAVLLKYAEVFRAACERAGFPAGEIFVDSRVALMLAVRDATGGLPMAPAHELENLRVLLAAYAAGKPVSWCDAAGVDSADSTGR